MTKRRNAPNTATSNTGFLPVASDIDPYINVENTDGKLATKLEIYKNIQWSKMGRSRKDPYSPHGGNFCRPEGEGRKNCF
jgi:hypothetical protein